MITFSQARRIAEAELAAMSRGGGYELAFIWEALIAKPYGWVFFYNDVRFMQDPERNREHALAGNGPFLVDRHDGKIHRFGSAMKTEIYLDAFERTIPRSWLQHEPEGPNP